ncbi:MAG: 2-hydroxyacyl-CoA dehydratase family protein [Desulfatiglans sp.]|jgi:hypothetical protein|nr:2-hydroxyacyl-CoA dehydratase family protein [Thermodesulfobacteriota bacterium]MEE4353909.1 2-hydroxyacyl-CoA dehydratase family protein [Desulfatiglans sp.]
MDFTELFSLLGYEKDEIKEEGSRIGKALEIMEIDDDDIKFAVDRIKKYYDVELVGVRKILGFWMDAAIELVMAKDEGKKLVYMGGPPEGKTLTALNMLDDVVCTCPEIAYAAPMGCFFDKLTPVLEAGEMAGVPSAFAHCSENIIGVGMYEKELCPKPEVFISSGFYCDQSAKFGEFIDEIYGIPVIQLECVEDANWDEFPAVSERRVKYFGESIRDCLNELESTYRLKLSEDILKQARVTYGKYWYAMGAIWDLMIKADPQPISCTIFPLMVMGGVLPSKRIQKTGIKVLNTLVKEIKKRADEGKGVCRKGAPRTALQVGSLVDPSLDRMFEECGLAMIGNWEFWKAPTEWVKSKYTTFEDKTAEGFLQHGIIHSAPGFIQLMKDACKYWNLDGLILFYPFNCRPMACSAIIAKKIIESEMDIPVLPLEGDFADSRRYSSAALRTRVETFVELLKMNKVA